MARRVGRGGFSSRVGTAHGAAGSGSGDDEFSWRWQLRAHRGSARLAQRLQAADAEDAGGRAGVDGSEGPRRRVPDGAVRALPAEREGAGAGDAGDVCRWRFDAQGERDHRGAVRAGGVQEPGVVADGEAGRGDRGVADASPDAGVSVPGGGRALRACASGRRGGEPGRAGGVRHRRAWLPRGAGRVGGGVRVRGELGRGVRGAEAAWAQRRSYVVSDDHAGMVKAIGRHFQGAVWQRCQVHFVRNALSLCGVAQRPLVLSLMKTIIEAGTRDAERAALKTAVAELQKKAPKTALLLEEHGEEILGVYALPEPHRKRMRTTNMLERQNQELKRRTRVVRVFPNGQSCLRLVSALLIETSQQWMERLYLRMEEEPADQTDAQAA